MSWTFDAKLQQIKQQISATQFQTCHFINLCLNTFIYKVTSLPAMNATGHERERRCIAQRGGGGGVRCVKQPFDKAVGSKPPSQALFLLGNDA
jgi:hypothetical protein